jgi:hypothetical protein
MLSFPVFANQYSRLWSASPRRCCPSGEPENSLSQTFQPLNLGTLKPRPRRHRGENPVTASLFSPFTFIRLRTLSFSVSRKSCICHSYENNRGVYQLFPFWNSRKVWPREFCRFLITHQSNSLPLTLFRSAHPVKDAHPSRVRCGGRGILLRCSFPCYNFHYLLCVYALAHSFALFCTHAKLNPFLFMRFRTLCEKRPGGVGGTLHLLP